MRALVIYDGTGKIWSIVYGTEEEPAGLLHMFVDMPEGAMLERIDVSDPANHKPVYNYLPESDIGRLMKKVDVLSEDLDTNKIDMAMAITDLYEFAMANFVPTVVEEENNDVSGDEATPSVTE